MSYRFDRFTEREATREATREAENEKLNAEYAERRRLASRSMWERIYDLSESDELKEILWALNERLPSESDQ